MPRSRHALARDGAPLIPRSIPHVLHDLLASHPRLHRWTRVVTTTHAAAFVGAVLALTGGLAVLGWVGDVWWLVQPVRSFAPMRVGTALGWAVLGAAVLGSATHRVRALTYGLAVLAVFLGTLPLQHALGLHGLWDVLSAVPSPRGVQWHETRPGQIALSSGVFVALGGVGLLAILSRQRGVWSSIVLAVCGGIVMLLATAVVAGQVFGVLDDVRYGQMLGSALQSIFCALLLSTYFNVLAWTRQAGFAPPPNWLPISVGAGALLATALLWRAMLGSEERRLQEQGRVAARATRTAIERQLGAAQQAMVRMSRYGVAPDARWRGFVTQMVDDMAGMAAVVWTDSLVRVRGSDARASPALLDSIERTLRPRSAALRAGGDVAQMVALGGEPARALMVVPRCRAPAPCGDLLVALLDARALLTSVLADSVLGFHMAIGDGSRWFRASAPPPARDDHFLIREPLLSDGPAWELGVWPNARTAAATPSALSDIVLLLGIAVSVLLALALRLLQAASRAAREDERATLTGALQSTTDGLWEWDLPTDRVMRSAQLWARLGYGDGSSHPRMSDWLALVHPQDRETVASRLQAHVSGATDAFEAQYRVRNAAGRWHDFVDRGRIVLRTADGAPARLLGMFADITDRRHAEESLRQAESMSTMGRLAARIAHEINNPLAGIQSAFLLVKDAIPPDHPHAKYVGAIEREVQRISEVTRQLYETYRPETESSSHAPVQTVVGDAVAFIEQVNRHAGVTIDVALGDVAAVVRLPNSILRQCVYNLVQNAIEASPRGARVHVEGEIDRGEFILTVRDEGAGVPPELRERIFDPFVSTKPSQLSTGGMGMGLALVRRALEAAGGSIELVDAPDGGAQFIARIPLVDHTSGVTA